MELIIFECRCLLVSSIVWSLVVLQQALVSLGIFMLWYLCRMWRTVLSVRACLLYRGSKLFGKLSTFVTVVWKPGKRIFCNKFVGVV